MVGIRRRGREEKSPLLEESGGRFSRQCRGRRRWTLCLIGAVEFKCEMEGFVRPSSAYGCSGKGSSKTGSIREGGFLRCGPCNGIRPSPRLYHETINEQGLGLVKAAILDGRADFMVFVVIC